MQPPDPFPAPPPGAGYASPARAAAALARALARHGITGIYTAASEKFARTGRYRRPRLHEDMMGCGFSSSLSYMNWVPYSWGCPEKTRTRSSRYARSRAEASPATTAARSTQFFVHVATVRRPGP